MAVVTIDYSEVGRAQNELKAYATIGCSTSAGSYIIKSFDEELITSVDVETSASSIDITIKKPSRLKFKFNTIHRGTGSTYTVKYNDTTLTENTEYTFDFNTNDVISIVLTNTQYFVSVVGLFYT